jgi:hypothetical protein
VAQDTDASEEVGRDTLRTAYEVIGQRRTAYDALLWQAPALGATAQAFLITIAYGTGSSTLARAVTGLLAFWVAICSRRLMAAHRHFEVADSVRLEKIETLLGLPSLLGAAPHAPPWVRDPRKDKLTWLERVLVARSRGGAQTAERGRPGLTYQLWHTSQLLFAAAGVAAPLIAIIRPQWLG